MLRYSKELPITFFEFVDKKMLTIWRSILFVYLDFFRNAFLYENMIYSGDKVWIIVGFHILYMFFLFVLNFPQTRSYGLWATA